MSELQTHKLILSVGDAHSLAPRTIETQEDRDLLNSIAEAVLENDITGDNNDYHNLANIFAGNDDFKSAYNIIKKGLKQYPYDIDLLSDGIKFGANCNMIEDCEAMITTLASRPFVFWNWRTFTFVIDYYILSISWKESGAIPNTLEKALAIAKEYQKTLPRDERGYVAEAEIYLCQSKNTLAKKVLHKAIYDIKDLVTPQCCLKYADLLLASGEYEAVIDVAKIGLMSSAQQQPTARTGYFAYVSALAKDAMIHRGNEFEQSEKINDVFIDYAIAYNLLSSTDVYLENIKTRTEILSAKSGIEFETKESDRVKEFLRMMEKR